MAAADALFGRQSGIPAIAASTYQPRMQTFPSLATAFPKRLQGYTWATFGLYHCTTVRLPSKHAARHSLPPSLQILSAACSSRCWLPLLSAVAPSYISPSAFIPVYPVYRLRVLRVQAGLRTQFYAGGLAAAVAGISPQRRAGGGGRADMAQPLGKQNMAGSRFMACTMRCRQAVVGRHACERWRMATRANVVAVAWRRL